MKHLSVTICAIGAAMVAVAAPVGTSSFESNAITIDARADACAVLAKAEPGLEARSWTAYVTSIIDYNPFASALMLFLR